MYLADIDFYDGSSDELKEHGGEIEAHEIDEMGDFENLGEMLNNNYRGLEEESA